MKVGDRVSFTREGTVDSIPVGDIVHIQFDGISGRTAFWLKDSDKFTVTKPPPKVGDKVKGMYGGQQARLGNRIVVGTLIHIRRSGAGVIIVDDDYETVYSVGRDYTHYED